MKKHFFSLDKIVSLFTLSSTQILNIKPWVGGQSHWQFLSLHYLVWSWRSLPQLSGQANMRSCSSLLSQTVWHLLETNKPDSEQRNKFMNIIQWLKKHHNFSDWLQGKWSYSKAHILILEIYSKHCNWKTIWILFFFN